MILSHDVTGDGPAVILLHSTVCDRRMWDPQLPALVGAGHRVVRCDLRGFGESPMPTGPYSNAGDVLDLLDSLGIERAAVVGASGGGKTALELAARWPERVTALVLLAPAVAGHEPSAGLAAFGEREEELFEAGDLAAATELNVDTWLGPEADEATRAKVREMQRHAFEVQSVEVGEDVSQIRVEYDVAAITAPTLLVTGAHDFPDFTAMADGLAARIDGAKRLDLPWAGHLPSLERPAEVDALLLDFLER